MIVVGQLRRLFDSPAVRRWALPAFVALLIAGGIAAFAGGREPAMGYLFTDLDPAAAKTVTDRLTQAGVPWQVSPDGSAIMAPVGRLASLRMELAGQDVSGPIGYAVLDAETPLGLSDQRARINQVRAIEGELARSIATLTQVEAARVHIVMPERTLFQRDERPATAAVTLRTRGLLPQSAVTAIRTLVAASVPALSPDRVSVVDQHGRLLSGAAGGAGALDERQAMLEARLRQDVEALIERATGPGRVRVQVAAELSRASRREESERFDPEGQVVARQTTVESSGDSREGETAQAATVATQLPERAGQPAATGSTDVRTSVNREVSEETEFNSSRTATLVAEDAGRLARVTVSVLVDPKTAAGRTLTPADLQRFQRLVETAVGFDARRGDRVAIEMMPLVAPDALPADIAEQPAIPAWTWIAGGLALLALLALLGVAGFMMLRRRRQPRALPAAPNATLLPEDEAAAATPDAPALEADAAPTARALPAPPRLDALPLAEPLAAAVAADPAGAAGVIRRLMAA